MKPLAVVSQPSFVFSLIFVGRPALLGFRDGFVRNLGGSTEFSRRGDLERAAELAGSYEGRDLADGYGGMLRMPFSHGCSLLVVEERIGVPKRRPASSEAPLSSFFLFVFGRQPAGPDEDSRNILGTPVDVFGVEDCQAVPRLQGSFDVVLAVIGEGTARGRHPGRFDGGGKQLEVSAFFRNTVVARQDNPFGGNQTAEAKDVALSRPEKRRVVGDHAEDDAFLVKVTEQIDVPRVQGLDAAGRNGDEFVRRRVDPNDGGELRPGPLLHFADRLGDGLHLGRTIREFFPETVLCSLKAFGRNRKPARYPGRDLVQRIMR